jgi:folate-binding protein YgfZ
MSLAMTSGFHATDRSVLRIAGADAREFLQGLVTNDVRRVDGGGAVYAALLSPQGKYLFDFFLLADGDAILVDVKADRALALAQRLAMYRLRAAVTVEPADLAVVQGIGAAPDGVRAVADPRHPDLGWRAYVADPDALVARIAPLDQAEFTARRVALAVPETGIELMPDDAYILEMGFERLHGVDFRKGCYVGQEVTARMKHKTELRKGLARLRLEGDAPPPGTAILADGKPAGTLHSSAGGFALAHLRFDRATGPLAAGEARLLWEPE